MKKIFILDDHELFGEGLKSILEKEDDMCVYKVVTNPDLMNDYILEFHPDIIICDIKIKEVNGLDVIKKYKTIYPNIKFIVLSGYNIDNYKTRAFQNGASAYVLKEDSPAHLVNIVREVYARNIKVASSQSFIISDLTPKEIEILSLMSQDLTNTQISEIAYMSKRTIEYHVSSIIKKLNVNSRLGAVIKGIRLGLIEETELYHNEKLK
ncbi:response regulator transcription factor [Macrococcus capreoli]|uniref:response regulator transcription factor n=1 Tax=Macrococcus capreoli TaxID=2982690 RepID=UPI0021D5F678|nr:response regulator transcription factor [Macrococcus sp. TMW 2.2395]MCU7558422.1 response regulator transcription factor [Macrococcus sp. TMW 2.2395]